MSGYEYLPVKIEATESRTADFSNHEEWSLDASVEKVYDLWFSDEGSDKNYRQFLLDNGDSDIKFGKWEKQEDNSFKRENFMKHSFGPLGSVVGCPMADIDFKQQIWRESPDRFVMSELFITRGLSILETFEVDADTEVVKDPSDPTKCIFHYKFRFRFVKSTMLESVLKLGLGREQKATGEKLLACLKELIANNPSIGGA